MQTLTDWIVVVFLIFFVISGWRKGLVRSLFGPISFFVFLIAGIIHFDLTHNFIRTLFIIAIGTISLTIILSLILTAARTAVAKEDRHYVFWGSRVAGALVSLLWRGTMLSVMILSIAVTPVAILGSEGVQKNVFKSRTYAVVSGFAYRRITPVAEIKRTFDFIKNPANAELIASSREFQDFIQHKRIQDFFTDPETFEQISNKEMVKLLSNPKIIEAFNDDFFMRKFTRAVQAIHALANES